MRILRPLWEWDRGRIARHASRVPRPASRVPHPDRPNILVITCHDLGRYLGCYGVDSVWTPRLDKLAGEGVRFASAFCAAPQCSASRAAMFTGRYPHANGVMGLTHGDFAWDLHPDERLIGRVLRDAGYATALLGVHHESRPGPPTQVAARCGMDEVVPPLPGEALTDAALERLSRLATSEWPFYMQVGYHEPHRVKGAAEPVDYMGFIGDDIAPDDERGVGIPPYLADEPAARQELAELQGAVRYVDAAIGRLLDGLERLGIADRTLVVVTTDHGLALPRAKCTLYDPGIEIALLARLPARGWFGGRVVGALVSNVDLFPTLLEVAGIPAGSGIHGRTLCPLLDGETNAHRDGVFAEMTYHDYYDPQRCIRTRDHKLIVYFSAAPSFMDPTQSWRPRTRTLIPENPALAYHPPLALYDLAADPYEQHNLAGDPAHAATERALLDQLHAWMRATGDPLLAGAVTSPSHERAMRVMSDE
jgi:arylsulfatase A-like enzyme